MNDETPQDRLMRAFVEAGWTIPEDLEILYTTDLLVRLHKKTFPAPFLDLTPDQAVTEESLERAKPGYGRMARYVRRNLRNANIKTMRAFVDLRENQAVRIFGGSRTKSFKAVEALVKYNGLNFGMDPTRDL